jgi:heme/copper-type cytochrome/quinol oxidase subunit 3
MHPHRRLAPWRGILVTMGLVLLVGSYTAPAAERVVVPENSKQLKSLTMLTGVIILERGLPSSIHRTG